MDLLRDLSQQMHKTLVASLHQVDYAQSHFDRIIGLRQGLVMFDCATTMLRPWMLDALYKIERDPTEPY